MDGEILYVRLYRPFSKSYINFKLPHYMGIESAKRWCKDKLPTWVLLSGIVHNKDEIDADV